MKISNKTTYPMAMVISIPLLILGGCANDDTVKMLPEESLAVSEIIDENEVTEQNSQTVDSLIAEYDSIEVIEPIEAAMDSPVEEKLTDKVKTPKPDEEIIGFGFDNSDINSQYGELLWQHAQYIKENKNLTINISGHTDSTGARVYNEMLSKKRADQVAKILIEFGVPEDRIKVEGVASDQPLAGAITNKEHRRVELEYQDQQMVSN